MLVDLIIVVIGLLIIFGMLRLIIDLIVSRITKDSRKQNIIGEFIIMLICLVGGITYLAYCYLITKSENDIRVAYWLIFSFILLTVKPVIDCIKYKR